MEPGWITFPCWRKSVTESFFNDPNTRTRLLYSGTASFQESMHCSNSGSDASWKPDAVIDQLIRAKLDCFARVSSGGAVSPDSPGTRRNHRSQWHRRDDRRERVNSAACSESIEPDFARDSGVPDGQAGRILPAMTFATLVEGIPRIDVLHMDTEGHDALILD
jgi:hypothetical protein